MNDLIKINAHDYGLEESKAKEISAMFKPMLNKMEDLEKEYNDVVARKISVETCVDASNLRKKYVKVRTGTADIHRDMKKFYLQGGRFVDGWKNAQLMASEGIEKKLMAIEKHYENIEKERIVKLQEERATELLVYLEPGAQEIGLVPETLGVMEDTVWVNFLSGTKTNYDMKVKAEKDAETARIKAEKEEVEERERIRKENELLKKEAEELEILIKIEAEKRAKAEVERRAKEEEELKKREEQAKAERETYELELRKECEKRERVESEAEIRREKLEAELKAKKDAEAKAKQVEDDRIQSELNKGDSAKVKDLLADLLELQSKYSFTSKKNKAMYESVIMLIGEIITYINNR